MIDSNAEKRLSSGRAPEQCRPQPIDRRGFLGWLGRGLCASAAGSVCVKASAATAAAAETRKPNVILFLVDDMGWMDSTVYGSEYYDTPNMERFAKRSMKFTDAYTASCLCSPTRASIIAGQYPARTGITSAVGQLPLPPPGTPRYHEAGPSVKMLLSDSLRFLAPEQITLAEALRAAGYRTGHFGKWRLGLAPEFWPEQQGFEVSFHGVPDSGPRSFFSPYGFKNGAITDGPRGEYIADRLTDEAIQFMEAHGNEPFFVNL